MLVYRSLGEIGVTTLFLTALFNMPLANATAIIQAAPLTVTLAAALFLSHPVGWRRYIVIGIGFVGVVLIVRPGAEGSTPTRSRRSARCSSSRCARWRRAASAPRCRRCS